MTVVVFWWDITYQAISESHFCVKCLKKWAQLLSYDSQQNYAPQIRMVLLASSHKYRSKQAWLKKNVVVKKYFYRFLLDTFAMMNDHLHATKVTKILLVPKFVHYVQINTSYWKMGRHLSHRVTLLSSGYRTLYKHVHTKILQVLTTLRYFLEDEQSWKWIISGYIFTCVRYAWASPRVKSNALGIT